MRLTSILKGAAAVLFVLSLPVLFGTISLRWLVSDTAWYRAGFEKHAVAARTGISPEELKRAADQISGYLLLQRENVDTPVRIGGETRPLFNDREIRHMKDVQGLLSSFYTLQFVAGAYALFYLLVGKLWLKGGYRPAIARSLRWASGLTVGLFGIVGLLSMLDFDELFLRFHMISFDNDLWQLDPAKDNLIVMFPQGFWYDSTIRLAMATGAQALGAAVVGTVLGRKRTAQPVAVSHQPVERRLDS